jgi:hypothetical protein
VPVGANGTVLMALWYITLARGQSSSSEYRRKANGESCSSLS